MRSKPVPITPIMALLLLMTPVLHAAGPEWRINLSGHTTQAIYVGREWAYVLLRAGYKQSLPATNQPIDPKPVPDSVGYSGPTDEMILCINLRAGTCQWARHSLGYLRCAVGPDDSLWGLGYQLVKLDPVTGQSLVTKAVSNDEERAADAIREGAVAMPLLGGTTGMRVKRDETGPAQVLDAATGKVSPALQAPLRRSPDGRLQLAARLAQSPTDVTTTFSALKLPTAAKPDASGEAWAFPTPGYSHSAPIWVDGDAVVLAGGPETKAAVTRLDGATGKVKWTTPLRGGAYAPDTVYLSDNSQLEYTWDAVGPLGPWLAAIDGRGVVVLLDPASGKIGSTYAGVTKHLAFPRAIGNSVVFFGADAVVGVSTDTLKPVSAAESAVRWHQAAVKAEADNDRPAATLARLHVLEATGEATLPELRTMGLLRYVPTGPVKAELVPWPPFIYIGSTDGSLKKLSAAAGQVIQTTVVDGDVARFMLRGNTLYRWGENRHEVEVATLVGKAPALDAQDPLRAGAEPPGAPYDWYTVTGYDGRVVERDGKRYRPLMGGGVRRLDGQVVTTLPAKVPIKTWNIYLGLGGPLGYGEGGIYSLDDALVPTSQLIRSGIEPLNRRAYGTSLVASDGKTIAAVFRRSSASALEIWTADGRTKMREEPVSLDGPSINPGRLQAIDGGYLCSGTDLAWVPTDPGQPAWRFALQSSRPARSVAVPNYSFGVPRVIDGKLIVSNNEGGVFFFDVATIAARNRAK